MKSLIYFVLTFLAALPAFSQSFETKVDYNKAQQPAVVCSFAYPPALVEDVIAADLKQKGLGKGKSSKSFTLFQAVNFNEISGDKIDLYINTERKSRKEKEITTVSVLVSKGYDNFISSTGDAVIMNNVMSYVNGLQEKLEKASLEIQIDDQATTVKKEDKKYTDLVDELADMEKKKRKLENDMEENKKNQEKQKAEAEKQKQILETLKGQRKD